MCKWPEHLGEPLGRWQCAIEQLLKCGLGDCLKQIDALSVLIDVILAAQQKVDCIVARNQCPVVVNRDRVSELHQRSKHFNVHGEHAIEMLAAALRIELRDDVANIGKVGRNGDAVPSVGAHGAAWARIEIEAPVAREELGGTLEGLGAGVAAVREILGSTKIAHADVAIIDGEFGPVAHEAAESAEFSRRGERNEVHACALSTQNCGSNVDGFGGIVAASALLINLQ